MNESKHQNNGIQEDVEQALTKSNDTMNTIQPTSASTTALIILRIAKGLLLGSFGIFGVVLSFYTSEHIPMIVSICLGQAIVFLLYDWLIVHSSPTQQGLWRKTGAVVASIIPHRTPETETMSPHNPQEIVQPKDQSSEDIPIYNIKKQRENLRNFFNHNSDLADDQPELNDMNQMADLFPSTTVCFADIVGFTAWSSTRAPAQVFSFLETLYAAFDEIARRRAVFKVETVGDCYVAVAGLHESRADHTVVMAQFASDCLTSFPTLTAQLEVALGPDTADLGLRIGIHTGPVTAGVLRGDRSRFQLFGDTMNTTARIESTGERDCIHLSQEAAEQLQNQGKGHWAKKREDKIYAKGKGYLDTYWLEVNDNELNESFTSPADQEIIRQSSQRSLVSETAMKEKLTEKMLRLVDWNTELLVKLLKSCIARRNDLHVTPTDMETIQALEEQSLKDSRHQIVLDEVKETVDLPRYTSRVTTQTDPESIKLDTQITIALRDYVMNIALMYRDMPFHNFEHASHVTMSVVKLMSRIVSPSEASSDDQLLHDKSYGITSDPITQFAVVWSALVHDVDHSGVPNATLVKENAHIAQIYKDKSIAEQNSVDLAWDLFMSPQYEAVRRLLYETEDEFKRLRQLFVNSVMATDIIDKELGAFRKSRWNKAFDGKQNEPHEDMLNRKATIVIEHLIQASDVSHTMQHWHIYRKWNERFFRECYQAYKEGRTDNDPSESWYEGEIGFFDFYIIPLAKKLESCGVFGVSSDEYLNYAMQNRREWEAKGEEIVEQYLKKISKPNKSRRRRSGNTADY